MWQWHTRPALPRDQPGGMVTSQSDGTIFGRFAQRVLSVCGKKCYNIQSVIAGTEFDSAASWWTETLEVIGKTL